MIEINKNDKDFDQKILDGLNLHYEPTWLQSCGLVRGDCNGGIRYACAKCKLCVQLSYSEIDEIMQKSGLEKKTVKDPITAKGWIPYDEIVVRERFMVEAEKIGCTHLQERIKLAGDKQVKQALEIQAIMNLMKSSKKE